MDSYFNPCLKNVPLYNPYLVNIPKIGISQYETYLSNQLYDKNAGYTTVRNEQNGCPGFHQRPHKAVYTTREALIQQKGLKQWLKARRNLNRHHPFQNTCIPASAFCSSFEPLLDQSCVFEDGRPIVPFEVPSADTRILEEIKNDPVGFINVQGKLKEVRFYGEKSIVMLDWDDPRDISFETSSRRVVIDDRDIVILVFNDPYKAYTFPDGTSTRIRLGVPTRDFYIDGKFFEATFGGPPFEVFFGGSTHKIQIGGPNPKICVGSEKRKDIMAGRINLIIDEDLNNIFNLYLDSKPQRFDINGIPIVLKFVSSLKFVILNGIPFNIEFGGCPIRITIHDEVHSLRFSSAPKGIVPGQTKIEYMDNYSGIPNVIPSSRDISAHDTLAETCPPSSAMADRHHYHYHYFTGLAASDKLPMPLSTPGTQNAFPIASISVQEGQSQHTNSPEVNNINVTELYTKLIEKGIISGDNEVKANDNKRKRRNNVLDFSKPETLKERNIRFVHDLYQGAQCHFCSLRFFKRDGDYASHIDWHYQVKMHRQARRTRWWSHASEFPRSEHDISDLSWFEKQISPEILDECEKIFTVPSRGHGENPLCFVCREGFKQFFNEEKEEWHLKNAVIRNEKVCHLACSEDACKEKSSRSMVHEYNISSGDEVITVHDGSPKRCSTDEQQTDQEIHPEERLLEGKLCIDCSENGSFENETDIIDIIEVNPQLEVIDLSEECCCDFVECKDSDVGSAGREPENASDKIWKGDGTTIDGNVEYSAHSIVTPVPIKVNITQRPLLEVNDELVRKGSMTEENHNEVYTENISPASVKPRISKADMATSSKIVKGGDVSSLCSLM